MNPEGRVVEHWGTFEVANFGDLLYPTILAPFLDERTARIELVGPLGGVAPMGLDASVRRAVRYDEGGFWGQASSVDAIVLGGGDLIHDGDFVVESNGTADRLDAWAFAVASGLLATVRPFVWNAVGVPFDLAPAALPLLREVCHNLDLLTVRDERSRARLEAAGVEREISVVPDTGILAGDVFGPDQRRSALDELRRAGRLPETHEPHVAVHMSFAPPGTVEELAGALAEVRAGRPDLSIVLLELGATHGDSHLHRAIAERLGGRTWQVDGPTLVQAAAVLGAADAIVSTSYHAALVGAAFDVPTVAVLHGSHRPSKQVELARSLDREQWLIDRPSTVSIALEAVLRGEGRQDATRVASLTAAARGHLEALAEVITTAVRPPSDLAERDAAHRSLLAALRSLRERTRQATEAATQLDEHARRARDAARLWEAAYWRVRDRVEDDEAAAPPGPSRSPLIVETIRTSRLESAPYRWGHVGPIFGPEDAQRLAATFPLDEAELREGADGRRSWRYLVRCLVPMAGVAPHRAHQLDPSWRALVDDLVGADYRTAMSCLTGVDLTGLHIEANAFSYGRGAYQEPHPDLPEKIVTHVLWFNERWVASDGGCLRILNSNDIDDVAHELLPELGWSAVFVRSASSWHAVTPVAEDVTTDRRAVVVTFHRPGSTSTMWPEAG